MQLLDVRPYQLMCIVCRIGEGYCDDLGDPRLTEILHEIRRNPCLPVRVRCNVDSTYSFQCPGNSENTPEGDLFNVRRDLEILMRLGLMPGATWVASDLVRRLYAEIRSCRDICDVSGPASAYWRGCARAASGFFEKGIALGVRVFLPGRSSEEMKRVKRESAQAINDASLLRIRPHHLMCMTCFHGRMPILKPIEPDNLYELIAAIHRNPRIPITLTKGCCMVCPPCPEYHPETEQCLGYCAMSLRDERKDLEVLMRLGMNYGDTLPAAELFSRLFAAIATTVDVCGNHGEPVCGPAWKTCGGPEGKDAYLRGRAAGIGIPGLRTSCEHCE